MPWDVLDRRSYDVTTTQHGTIRVYEVSAMDGSAINVVNIPVTLARDRDVPGGHRR